MSDLDEKIARLEAEIADLKKRWPAHSLKPAMFTQLEDLEEELENLKAQREKAQPQK